MATCSDEEDAVIAGCAFDFMHVHGEDEKCHDVPKPVTNDAVKDFATAVAEREKGVKHDHEEGSGCPYRVDIVDVRNIDSEVIYLVRFTETCNQKRNYFLKRYDDFKRLDEDLRNADQKRPSDEITILAHLPDLPSNGRFGFRRSLSKLGMSDFIDKQREALQQCMDTLIGQVPDLSTQPHLQAFFCKVGKAKRGALNALEEQALQQEQMLMSTMIADARSFVTLESVQGFWRLTTSQRIWQIMPDGIATLDGRHRGHQFDWIESGVGAERTIMRPDGWEIDLDKSTPQKLIWLFPGKAVVEWVRVADDIAKEALQRVKALRESIRKNTEARRIDRVQTRGPSADAQ
eukprot:CAMPEP_0115256632 /NCGR_PEP_ID=MMETSP0270-20121206/46350_1 /TAXON_ID=71861 /ORGANISM="Scrippsiella trochoidea, Strain CCMP3099" /LENGTH=346 /DNA_ID=CAMNT_0002672299 /DNA_START=5 /DNA_END=1045 /DNA_ORIENTATION=+